MPIVENPAPLIAKAPNLVRALSNPIPTPGEFFPQGVPKPFGERREGSRGPGASLKGPRESKPARQPGRRKGNAAFQVSGYSSEAPVFAPEMANTFGDQLSSFSSLIETLRGDAESFGDRTSGLAASEVEPVRRNATEELYSFLKTDEGLGTFTREIGNRNKGDLKRLADIKSKAFDELGLGLFREQIAELELGEVARSTIKDLVKVVNRNDITNLEDEVERILAGVSEKGDVDENVLAAFGVVVSTALLASAMSTEKGRKSARKLAPILVVASLVLSACDGSSASPPPAIVQEIQSQEVNPVTQGIDEILPIEDNFGGSVVNESFTVELGVNPEELGIAESFNRAQFNLGMMVNPKGIKLTELQSQESEARGYANGNGKSYFLVDIQDGRYVPPGKGNESKLIPMVIAEGENGEVAIGLADEFQVEITDDVGNTKLEDSWVSYFDIFILKVEKNENGEIKILKYIDPFSGIEQSLDAQEFDLGVSPTPSPQPTPVSPSFIDALMGLLAQSAQAAGPDPTLTLEPTPTPTEVLTMLESNIRNLGEAGANLVYKDGILYQVRDGVEEPMGTILNPKEESPVIDIGRVGLMNWQIPVEDLVYDEESKLIYVYDEEGRRFIFSNDEWKGDFVEYYAKLIAGAREREFWTGPEYGYDTDTLITGHAYPVYTGEYGILTKDLNRLGEVSFEVIKVVSPDLRNPDITREFYLATLIDSEIPKTEVTSRGIVVEHDQPIFYLGSTYRPGKQWITREAFLNALEPGDQLEIRHYFKIYPAFSNLCEESRNCYWLSDLADTQNQDQILDPSNENNLWPYNFILAADLIAIQ